MSIGDAGDDDKMVECEGPLVRLSMSDVHTELVSFG